MKKIKQVTILFIILLFTFIFLIILSIKSNKNRLLNRNTKIELRVNKIRKYKGVILMNDSVAIFQNTPRIVKDSIFNGNALLVRYAKFGDLRDPFTLIKKKGNDTIIVVKEDETLYYKLFE